MMISCTFDLPIDIIFIIIKHIDAKTVDGFLTLLNLCCVSKTINYSITTLPNAWNLFPYRLVLQSQLYNFDYGPKRLWISRLCNPMFGKTHFDISLTKEMLQPIITIYMSRSKLSVHKYGENTPITTIPINRCNIYNQTLLKYKTAVIKKEHKIIIHKNDFSTNRRFAILLSERFLQNTPPQRVRNKLYLNLPGLNAHVLPSNKNFKFNETIVFGKVNKNEYECVFNHEKITLLDSIVMCFLPFI